jgi:hypothetical protein
MRSRLGSQDGMRARRNLGTRTTMALDDFELRRQQPEAKRCHSPSAIHSLYDSNVYVNKTRSYGWRNASITGQKMRIMKFALQ